MKVFMVYNTNNGQFKYSTFFGTLSKVILSEDEEFLPGQYNGSLFYVKDGEVKDRPELDLPDHIVVNLSDNEVELPDIPEDTVVRYDGMEAGVADKEGITLSFDEAGKWEIYFDPPFPYQPAIIEAEVEDG